MCVDIVFVFFFLTIPQPPSSTRTATLFPDTTLFRALHRRPCARPPRVARLSQIVALGRSRIWDRHGAAGTRDAGARLYDGARPRRRCRGTAPGDRRRTGGGSPYRARGAYADADRRPWRCGEWTPPSPDLRLRSEEHTSELQSLMCISYAVFCLKKKK